jgi:hypothetical protein
MPLQRTLQDTRRRHSRIGFAVVGAVALFAGYTLRPSTDRGDDTTAATGVIVVDAPREQPSGSFGAVPEPTSSAPLRAPLPPDLARRVSAAIGGTAAELHDVRRSEKRADAYCGELATAGQPARRRVVLLEQPFMIAIDDGDPGFADVMQLCGS